MEIEDDYLFTLAQGRSLLKNAVLGRMCQCCWLGNRLVVVSMTEIIYFRYESACSSGWRFCSWWAYRCEFNRQALFNSQSLNSRLVKLYQAVMLSGTKTGVIRFSAD
ncbi:hypothetical protein NPIL_433271 [Nephila pilipes]|uniref:Uncharacterized protein n=1 Tax=Nephila pilipes TaxID=299642 RepID=A0A8X6TLT0_NEPPI|nr:hypothetical protein NPIL_433271 [Nephila pilipes]